MNRFTNSSAVSEEEPISAEDQEWLDKEVLQDRQQFPEMVYDHHMTSRFARYA